MAKRKKKKIHVRDRIKRTSTVKYVCSNCGIEEEIPENVLEYFDNINPQQLIYGAHEFECEICGDGIMKPDNEVKPIVRGFGLFEGVKFD